MSQMRLQDHVESCPVCDTPLRPHPVGHHLLTQPSADAALAARHRAGDPLAFGQLHERHAGKLRSYAVWVLNERRADADDVVQEAFERAHHFLLDDPRARRGDLTLAPWLRTVVHHRCIDELRRHGRDDPAPADALVCRLPSPDERVILSERLRSVTDSVRALPERQRRALVLHALDGRTHDAIAQELRVSTAATKSLVNRARVELRCNPNAA